jgi:hypothetical protein
MTEYFVRGTEPTEICHLHVGRSLFAKMGDWFRDSPKVEGERPDVGTSEVAAPAPAADVARASSETKAEPDEPKKKRGFWSRLFGRGDKNDDKKKDEKRPPN